MKYKIFAAPAIMAAAATGIAAGTGYAAPAPAAPVVEQPPLPDSAVAYFSGQP